MNSRAHGTTGKVPFEEIGKEGLISVSGKDYDTSRVNVRIAARDCFISYEGNRYELPYRLAGKAVVVKDDDDSRIVVYWRDEMVVEHRKADGKGQVERIPGLNEELWQKVLGRRWPEHKDRSSGMSTDSTRMILVGREIPLVVVENRDLAYYEEAAV